MTTDLVQLVREGHAAFNDRDKERLLSAIAEDATWHTPGDSPLAGTYKGREQIWEQVFKPLWEQPGSLETHEVIATDRYVASTNEFVMKAEGDETRFAFLELARIEDGKLVERKAFVDEQATFDQLIEQAARQPANA
ncbi:MAG: nuclear transport factor 2 family protein [Nitriliruptorales bacterium]|nr:nuclear transport factor 2 family protein [Nitriliruptorales bacterium]